MEYTLKEKSFIGRYRPIVEIDEVMLTSARINKSNYNICFPKNTFFTDEALTAYENGEDVEESSIHIFFKDHGYNLKQKIIDYSGLINFSLSNGVRIDAKNLDFKEFYTTADKRGSFDLTINIVTKSCLDDNTKMPDSFFEGFSLSLQDFTVSNNYVKEELGSLDLEMKNGSIVEKSFSSVDYRLRDENIEEAEFLLENMPRNNMESFELVSYKYTIDGKGDKPTLPLHMFESDSSIQNNINGYWEQINMRIHVKDYGPIYQQRYNLFPGSFEIKDIKQETIIPKTKCYCEGFSTIANCQGEYDIIDIPLYIEPYKEEKGSVLDDWAKRYITINFENVMLGNQFVFENIGEMSAYYYGKDGENSITTNKISYEVRKDFKLF